MATSTTVFALIDQALLRPLPFPQAERLVTVGQYREDKTNTAGPAYLRSVRAMQSVASAGLVRNWVIDANVARGDVAEVVRSLHADRGFLDTLGLPLALGRNFSVEEDRPNGAQAVILSHAYWRDAYGADPGAVGSTLLLEGKVAQIVGVLPAGFQWPQDFDLILPMRLDPATTELSTNETVVARLKPGVSVATASAEAATVIGNLLLSNISGEQSREKWQQTLHRYPPNALPIKTSVFTAQSGNTLWLFSATAACVLLIATVNLTSLMLLRTLARSHDHAVRSALGAAPRRLASPVLAEGALVGALGAAAGLLLAWLGLRGLAGWVPLEWMRGEPVALGWASVVFALVSGLCTALMAGGLGLWRMRRLPLAGELAGGGRADWSRSSGRLGKALVVAQVALAVVLLTGAGLFIRSLHELHKVPMGFESHAVSIFSLSPVKADVRSFAQNLTLADRIVERLQRVPGVQYVAAASNPPTTTQLNMPIILPDARSLSTQFRLMTPQMLDVFRIPLLAGRGITRDDGAGSERVCLVSAAFAQQYLQGKPLGQMVMLGDVGMGPPVPMRVVGVVGDVRQFGPAEPAPPIVYTALAQVPEGIGQLLSSFGGLTYSLRMRPGMAIDQAILQRAVAEIAPRQPISDLRTMDTVVASTTSQQKLNLLLISLFSTLALLLAAVGLYAVMAVAVAARRHEFGVRAVRGAPPARLLRQVLGEGARQL
ncbi:MAG: ABC transporter permease, partial [Pseudomonas sp.]